MIIVIDVVICIALMTRVEQCVTVAVAIETIIVVVVATTTHFFSGGEISIGCE